MLQNLTKIGNKKKEKKRKGKGKRKKETGKKEEQKEKGKEKERKMNQRDLGRKKTRISIGAQIWAPEERKSSLKKEIGVPVSAYQPRQSPRMSVE